MNTERRIFINQLSFVAAFAALSKPIGSMASISKRISTLHSSRNEVAVYHTNDLHGNIEPVLHGAGGLNQIQTLLNKQETKGLLLDAGGFLNLSKSISAQKMLIRTMNDMGYHAAAVGNDELALGQDHLASLIPTMRFSLVNCNYRFDGELRNLIKPYIIIRSGRFKIGITGIGHKVNGIKYDDAIQSANNTAAHLKEKEKCDLVICLSHLGYAQPGDQPDDQKLVTSSTHIDMVVSGHNRFLLTGPVISRNRLKREVIINQAGFNGLMMGKTVFGFAGSGQKSILKAKNLIAGLPNGPAFSDSFAKLKQDEQLLTIA